RGGSDTLRAPRGDGAAELVRDACLGARGDLHVAVELAGFEHLDATLATLVALGVGKRLGEPVGLARGAALRHAHEAPLRARAAWLPWEACATPCSPWSSPPAPAQPVTATATT